MVDLPMAPGVTVNKAVSPRRLAIVDDHILMLDGLSKWVQVNSPDFEIVVAAGSWAELVDELPRRPEVVIMAYDLDGAEPVQMRIQSCIAAGAKVVIMSTVDSIEGRKESLDAGASAFVSKARPAAEVLSAARMALEPDTSSCVLEAEGSLEDDTGRVSRFGDEELAILRLYSTGYSTVDIALIKNLKFEAVRSTLKRVRELYRTQGREAVSREQLRRRAAEDGYLV